MRWWHPVVATAICYGGVDLAAATAEPVGSADASASAGAEPAVSKEGTPARPSKVLLAITLLRDFRLFESILTMAKLWQPVPGLDLQALLVLGGVDDDSYATYEERSTGVLKLMKVQGRVHRGAIGNAILSYFRENAHWDYMYLHDGNDFLYTTFPMALAEVIRQTDPDVVAMAVAGCDRLARAELREHPHFIPGASKLELHHHSIYDLEIVTEDSFIPNPFEKVTVDLPNVFDQGFRDGEIGVKLRLVLFSRQAVATLDLPLFDEEMLVHEDIVPELKLLEMVQQPSPTLRVAFLWTTHLFLRNAFQQNAFGEPLANSNLTLDNTILMEKYKARYSSVWPAGGLNLQLLPLDDGFIKRTTLWDHKAKFLSIMKFLLHKYIRLQALR